MRHFQNVYSPVRNSGNKVIIHCLNNSEKPYSYIMAFKNHFFNIYIWIYFPLVNIFKQQHLQIKHWQWQQLQTDVLLY